MEKMFIPSDSKYITYMGRTDSIDPAAVRIVFAGTQMTLRFVGTESLAEKGGLR